MPRTEIKLKDKKTGKTRRFVAKPENKEKNARRAAAVSKAREDIEKHKRDRENMRRPGIGEHIGRGTCKAWNWEHCVDR